MKANLKSHESIHTGENCNECFTDARLLKDHELIHFGEKPYPCKQKQG